MKPALNQTLQLWSAAVDGYGDKTYTNVGTKSCRWEDKAVKYINPAGIEKTSKSTVYTASGVTVDNFISLTLTTVTATTTNPPDDLRVKQVDKSPDLKGTVSFIKLYL